MNNPNQPNRGPNETMRTAQQAKDHARNATKSQQQQSGGDQRQQGQGGKSNNQQSQQGGGSTQQGTSPNSKPGHQPRSGMPKGAGTQ